MPKSWRSTSRSRAPRPAHHANDAGTSFKNPWPSAGAPTWTEIAQHSFPLGWYKDALHSHKSAREVQVVTPDWGAANVKSKGLEPSNSVIGTWLGHAGALVELPLEGTRVDGSKKASLWLLFDPIFSIRAGPTQYTGPTRMKKSPCQVQDLPGCDAVFISHNHYDHLDLASIKALMKKFPKARYFVPLGNKTWLTATSISKDFVFELDWWQDREYSLEDFGYPAGQKADETLIRFTCVPAQHNSGRTAVDAWSTLWCGWVAEQLLSSKSESETAKVKRKASIYHAGDTGYRRTAKSDVVCPAFKEIGQKLGPFDLSFIPIWRGGSLGFVSYLGLRLSHNDIPSALHGSPTDAVDIHLDVKSKNTIGIHFGTFIGSENESYEAMIEFAEACEEKGVSRLEGSEAEVGNGQAGILDIGGSYVVEINQNEKGSMKNTTC